MADTIRGQIRDEIVANAEPWQKITFPPKFFGKTHIIGENYQEAAEYYRSKIDGCKHMADEIILNSEIEDMFHVALLNEQ